MATAQLLKAPKSCLGFAATVSHGLLGIMHGAEQTEGLLVTKQRTYRGGHLPPLQNHVLGDPSVRVHIHPLIFIAHQKLHAVRVGENDDCMGLNAALDLRTEAGRLGSSPGPWWYSGILSAR